jgi:integrase/recombinase XerD
MSSIISGAIHDQRGKSSNMPAISLYDGRGSRKYLTAEERRAFAAAALRTAPPILTFCLTLVYTGARISELLSLTFEHVDCAENAIILETLKRRRRGVFRAIPVPSKLVARLVHLTDDLGSELDRDQSPRRIWNWGRTTAWKHVKEVMKLAGIRESLAMPKSARHAFGVNAIQTGVALNVLQRWMGHARIETTSIYADVLGKEERALAQRTWTSLRDLPL